MSRYMRLPSEPEPEEDYTNKLLRETLGSSQGPYPSLVSRVFKYIDNPEAAQAALQEKKQKQRQQDWILLKALVLHSLRASYMAGVRQIKRRYARTRRVQAEKQRNRGLSAIPVISMPIVIGFILIVVIIALAYTLTHPFPRLPVSSGSGNRGIPQSSTITIPQQAGVTPTRSGVSLSGSPTVTTGGGPKPTITLCMTPQDRTQNRIRVCGINFTPGDRVSLYLIAAGGGQPRIRHAVTVDAQGKFIDLWVINNCRDVPSAIFAQDVSPSHPTEISQWLSSIQFESCPVSSPGGN
jgi:hypothetical protein